jgi:hypothetical protein
MVLINPVHNPLLLVTQTPDTWQYFFIYGLFEGAVSSSDYIAPKD